MNSQGNCWVSKIQQHLARLSQNVLPVLIHLVALLLVLLNHVRLLAAVCHVLLCLVLLIITVLRVIMKSR